MCRNFQDFVFLSVGFEGRELCEELGYRISEYMIRMGFDRAFQISFNIIRMMKGCRDVVDTMRGFGGHGEWEVGGGLSQN